MGVSHPSVKRVAGEGGLPKLVVSTELAEAEIYVQGAHITHFQPRGEQPVLFLSQSNTFESGKPIVGGVPVIFPWLGRKGDRKLPAEGLARTHSWMVLDVQEENDRVILGFGLGCGPGCEAAYPQPCQLIYRVGIDRALTMELWVQNRGADPLICDVSLLPYLAVPDVQQMALHGLGGSRYLDRADAFRSRDPGDPILRFGPEVDRIYLTPDSPLSLEDGDGRTVTVRHSAPCALVWVPGPRSSRAPQDLGPEEWQQFLCVGPAEVSPAPMRIAVGGSAMISATLSVQRPFDDGPGVPAPLRPPPRQLSARARPEHSADDLPVGHSAPARHPVT